ncbi:hypothetical protein P43SY_002641 [Pythium insidiosum]|uniref:Ion transport domain-containing protein n=1 Tax=Pythium insidiosum TaxID=114742 RepID=A0AAD5LRH0_PYTIN|nr:hypothetical protein P43SY_002641 [Pythium insidiosum]
MQWDIQDHRTVFFEPNECVVPMHKKITEHLTHRNDKFFMQRRRTISVAVSISVSISLAIPVAVSIPVSISIAIAVSIPIAVPISVSIALSIAVPVAITIPIPITISVSVPFPLSIAVAVALPLPVAVVAVAVMAVSVSLPLSVPLSFSLPLARTAAASHRRGGDGAPSHAIGRDFFWWRASEQEETWRHLAGMADRNERTQLLPDRLTWVASELPQRRRRSSDEDDGFSVRARTIRRDIWTILRYRASIPHRTSLQRASYAFEVGVLVLILLNVLLAMRQSAIISAQESYVNSDWYDSFLYLSTLAFSAEYLLRLWSCVEDERFCTPVWGRLKWMCRPMSVIDLVVLIPFYLEIVLQHEVQPASRGVLTLRGLRLLRIMSFLRLERSYNAMKRLKSIFARKYEELWVVSYLTAVIVLTASTTIFFLENPSQPEVFSSIGVCAWWAIETITSLGYGDIVPVTSGGRLFSSILAIWGIVLFTIPGAVLSSGFVEVMLEKQEQDKKTFQQELTRSLSREITGMHGMKYQLLSLQDMLRSPAVASYTRNFEGEREKLQDILEIALCYGIHCLSRNFQLKGITVDELRSVTTTWDEIEFYTSLLGKRFIDIAWATYSARSTVHLDASELDERMRRLDQRKVPSSFPSIEFPVCSFVEFLHANDPIREELYDFSGWLGDFGPAHTKTVRPTWEVDAASSDGEPAGDDLQAAEEGARRKPAFEWKLDILKPRENDGELRQAPHRNGTRSVDAASQLDSEADDSDIWSNISRSDASDPVFRWLQSVQR